MQRVKLYAQRSHVRTKAVSLFMDDDDYRPGRGTYRRVKSVEFEDVELFTDDSPVLDMSEDSAQELFNQLWSLGFRPVSEDGNVGMLQATQDHLSDMRKIVSEKLKVIL